MPMSPGRFVPDCQGHSYRAEYSSAFTAVPSRTVPFRSTALLPILLPPSPQCIRVARKRIAVRQSENPIGQRPRRRQCRESHNPPYLRLSNKHIVAETRAREEQTQKQPPRDA